MLGPSVIEKKLGLDVTECEIDSFTEERGSIMDSPKPKRRSVIQRKVVFFSLDKYT